MQGTRALCARVGCTVLVSGTNVPGLGANGVGYLGGARWAVPVPAAGGGCWSAYAESLRDSCACLRTCAVPCIRRTDQMRPWETR